MKKYFVLRYKKFPVTFYKWNTTEFRLDNKTNLYYEIVIDNLHKQIKNTEFKYKYERNKEMYDTLKRIKNKNDALLNFRTKNIHIKDIIKELMMNDNELTVIKK
jgi:hypothetical protein